MGDSRACVKDSYEWQSVGAGLENAEVVIDPPPLRFNMPVTGIPADICPLPPPPEKGRKIPVLLVFISATGATLPVVYFSFGGSIKQTKANKIRIFNSVYKS
jgi:hypothetical protein